MTCWQVISVELVQQQNEEEGAISGDTFAVSLVDSQK
jgi:hypothetical protein